VKMLYNYKYYANYIIKALACHTVKFTLWVTQSLLLKI
jgi:hypothetical protein